MISSSRTRLARYTVSAALCLCTLAGFDGNLIADKAEPATVQKPIRFGTRTVNLTLATPAAGAPPFLVVFASGDGGIRGVSKDLLRHLAERNYWVVGFSSPEAFKDIAGDSEAGPNYEAARD